MLFYVLYLPLFFTGPILTYDLFQAQVNSSPPLTGYKYITLINTKLKQLPLGCLTLVRKLNEMLEVHW